MVPRHQELSRRSDSSIHDSKNDQCALQRLAAEFVLHGGTPYKKSSHHVLLRCVDEVEASTIIEDIYRGECGTHMNRLMPIKKILRLSYYWLTMEINCYQHVKKCHTSQSYVNIIKAPSSKLHNLTTPFPFSIWGINVARPMPQKATNGHLYIIVAIDYFTKWVEVISLVVVTMKDIARFIQRHHLPIWCSQQNYH